MNYHQLAIPGVVPVWAIAPPVMAPVRMMTPPPGMRSTPAMPRVSVPPAPRFCRLSEGSGTDRQGGECRQDEFPHPFTSSMVVSYMHNEKASRITPFNHKFYCVRRSPPAWPPPGPAGLRRASPRPSPQLRALRRTSRVARSQHLSRRAQ